jgi:hypothetical protein
MKDIGNNLFFRVNSLKSKIFKNNKTIKNKHDKGWTKKINQTIGIMAKLAFGYLILGKNEKAIRAKEKANRYGYMADFIR